MRTHRVACALGAVAVGLGVVAASVSPAAASGGTWGTAMEVPSLAGLNSWGVAAVNSMSCRSAGNCAAGGSYSDGFGHAPVPSPRTA